MLEVVDDGAEQIIAATDNTAVLFAGEKLGTILFRSAEGSPVPREGDTQVSKVISEGATYLGLKPVNWAAMLG